MTRATLVLMASVAFAGCFPRGPALEGDADPDTCDEEFDDHTHIGAIDIVTLEAFAVGDEPQQVDFIVSSVTKPEVRRVRFEDGSFFAFHDEWYWFRLLNGVSACGSSATPEQGLGPFASIDEVYASLAGRDDLPLDLARTGDGRLVSPSFYELSLRTTPRVYAPGTLFRYADDRGGGGDRWAFEVEFVDAITADDLRTVHATLEDALPGDARLFWRAVSPDQNALADTLEAEGDAQLGERIVRVGEEPPLDEGARSCCSSMALNGSVPWCALALAIRRRRRSTAVSSGPPAS